MVVAKQKVVKPKYIKKDKDGNVILLPSQKRRHIVEKKLADGKLKIISDKLRNIDVNSVKSKKELKKKNNTIWGPNTIKAKAPYDLINRKSDNGWVEEIHAREHQSQVNKMTNTILNQAKGKKWTTATIRYVAQLQFQEHKDRPQFKFKTFSIRNPAKYNKKTKQYTAVDIDAHDLYDQIMKSTTSKFEGSDGVGMHYDIDTTWFKMSYKETVGNSKTSRKDGKSLKTQYFNTLSFKSEEGDCLLAIINNGTKLATIRKDLKLPDGGIDLKYIPQLEKYLKCNINVFEDNIKIISEPIDTDKKNITNTSFKYIYLYESKSKYDIKYDILLKNNHYSLILDKKPKIYFDPICGDRLQINTKDPNKRPIKLTKEEQIKSLINQGRIPAGFTNKKKNTTNELYFIFFDLETVFNRNNFCFLFAYSIAWLEIKASEVKTPEDFKKYYEKNKTNSTNFIKGLNCIKRFIEWIDENDSGKKYILIGYNNCKFDNFPLLNGLIDNDMLNDLVYVNNSLLQLKFSGRHLTFDLYKFTHCSLKKACQDFNIVPKKIDGFSHYLPQDAYNNGGWDELNSWLDTNIKKIEEYNKIDVLATASLFFTVRDAYEKLLNKDILNFTTLAQISYDCFKDYNKIKDINDKCTPAKDKQTDEEFRESYTGGRCQKFKSNYIAGKYKPIKLLNWISKNEYEEYMKMDKLKLELLKKEFNKLSAEQKKKFQKFQKYIKFRNLSMYDVKSLYPYVMLNRYYPTGKYNFTNKYFSDKLGIYNIEIIKQPDTKIIPYKDETLNWEYEKTFKKRITSVEIECLKRHGAEFKFIPWREGIEAIGIYWDSYSADLFKEYFEPIKNEKTKQDQLKKNKDPSYNSALRNICKLLLNSLSGKFGQRNYEEVTKLSKNTKDDNKFADKMKGGEIQNIYHYGDYRILKGLKKDEDIFNKSTSKPSHICAFIYAWARTYMYDLLYSRYNVIYTDTDSALLNYYDARDFESKYIRRNGFSPHPYFDLDTEESHKNDKGKVIKHIKVLGGEFGQFEEELHIEDNQTIEHYINAKKLYAIKITNKDGSYCEHGNECKDGKEFCEKSHSKFRMKGVCIQKDILISESKANEIEKMPDSNDYMYEYYKNHTNDERDYMEPFKKLYEKGKCYYISSQLKREINNNYYLNGKKQKLKDGSGELGIRQVFSIKKLEIDIKKGEYKVIDSDNI